MHLGFVLFCFSNTAKPAKRQPTAQPVPVAMAQPVVAPVAQNGKEIINKKIINNSIFSAFCFGEGINYSFTLRCSAVNCVRKIFKNEDLVL